jgi:hypothetical protein
MRVDITGMAALANLRHGVSNPRFSSTVTTCATVVIPAPPACGHVPVLVLVEMSIVLVADSWTAPRLLTDI